MDFSRKIRRQNRAQQALNAYKTVYEGADQDQRDAIVDLMADLAHFADAYGVNGHGGRDALRLAERHHQCENDPDDIERAAQS